jgi:hypothetical protein
VCITKLIVSQACCISICSYAKKSHY